MRAEPATGLFCQTENPVLEDIDMSGVLKKWNEFHPEAMGPERIARFERGTKLRKLWRIRGYFGKRK